MKGRYLEVTFRRGKPVAAYLYFPRNPGDTSARTERREPGFVIDFAADGRALGVEMIAPTLVSLAALNRVLEEIHQEPATPEEVAPVSSS